MQQKLSGCHEICRWRGGYVPLGLKLAVTNILYNAAFNLGHRAPCFLTCTTWSTHTRPAHLLMSMTADSCAKMNAAATDRMEVSRAYSALSAAAASSGRCAVRLLQQRASQSGSLIVAGVQSDMVATELFSCVGLMY